MTRFMIVINEGEMYKSSSSVDKLGLEKSIYIDLLVFILKKKSFFLFSFSF